MHGTSDRWVVHVHGHRRKKTGPDSFTYRTSDGIAPPMCAKFDPGERNNTVPVANNDTLLPRARHTSTVGGAAGLLINDTDPDTGGFLGMTTSEVAAPPHGTLTFNATARSSTPRRPATSGPIRLRITTATARTPATPRP